MLDVGRYLARIGYAGPAAATLATLRGVPRGPSAHGAVEQPFRAQGRAHRSRGGTALEKIVRRRRGGFCYRLNGLFAALLEALGFRVSRLAGRVRPAGIPFDHMALRVDLGLDGPWLADVGFGDSFVLPLRLEQRERQEEAAAAGYRLDAARAGFCSCAREQQLRGNTSSRRPMTALRLRRRWRYHQTSPRVLRSRRPWAPEPTETERTHALRQRLES